MIQVWGEKVQESKKPNSDYYMVALKQWWILQFLTWKIYPSYKPYMQMNKTAIVNFSHWEVSYIIKYALRMIKSFLKSLAKPISFPLLCRIGIH